jgi:hypothetical protein
VQQLLREHGSASPAQRLLLHYFGHGCRAPSVEGDLFFFSEERTHPKPMKIVKVLNTCACPLAFIFDCPCAACLAPHLRARRDLFALFACAPDERLPLSTGAPMDLFSSCLLMPYDTALWWHTQRHASVYDAPRMPSDANRAFLERFLAAVLDAIAFETQAAAAYQAWTLDPAVGALFRGFALAQRVLLAFNLHASALPELRPMAAHALWDVWDIAIDIAIALDSEPAQALLFELCVQTFDEFPSPGVYAIYAHFMRTPAFAADAAARLLAMLDAAPGAAGVAARSALRGAVLEMPRPDEAHLFMLAKMQATDAAPELDPQAVVTLAAAARSVACGMLNACLAVARAWAPLFARLPQVCLEKAEEGAPFAGLLLGLVIERGGRMNTRGLSGKCAALCASARADARATAVFALGVAGEPAAVPVLERMAADPDEIVREQVLWAMFAMVKNGVDRRGIGVIDRFASDQSQLVRKAHDSAKLLVGQLKAGVMKDSQTPNPILKNLIASVKAPGFVGRYRTNIFQMQLAE